VTIGSIEWSCLKVQLLPCVPRNTLEMASQDYLDHQHPIKWHHSGCHALSTSTSRGVASRVTLGTKYSYYARLDTKPIGESGNRRCQIRQIMAWRRVRQWWSCAWRLAARRCECHLVTRSSVTTCHTYPDDSKFQMMFFNLFFKFREFTMNKNAQIFNIDANFK